MLILAAVPLILALLLLLASILFGVIVGLWLDFRLVLIALTVVIWGPLAPLALWTAD